MLGRALQELKALPTVSGQYQLALSQQLNGVFVQADEIATKNGDQYITEEHLLLSLIQF